MVNGKNRNHSSITVFPHFSCTFQYILQYEFRAEQPPIPVCNSRSAKQTHLSNTSSFSIKFSEEQNKHTLQSLTQREENVSVQTTLIYLLI